MKRPKHLLNVDTNAKTVKGQKLGFLTGILYLAPADLSGYNVCPMASAGCKAACLNTAGRGGMSSVQRARLAKTLWYFEDRASFMAQLVKDIRALVRKAEREGLTPLVRLNGTSDIPWERIPKGDVAATTIRRDWPISDPYLGSLSLLEYFSHVQFYDYTKVTKRALAHARQQMPANYHLTFSLTEENDGDARAVLLAGGNVAAVFPEVPAGAKWDKDGRLVGAWGSYSARVVDGDVSDVRHLDDWSAVQGGASLMHTGVVVALKAKGKARHDTSGFVRPVL